MNLYFLNFEHLAYGPTARKWPINAQLFSRCSNTWDLFTFELNMVLQIYLDLMTSGPGDHIHVMVDSIRLILLDRNVPLDNLM